MTALGRRCVFFAVVGVCVALSVGAFVAWRLYDGMGIRRAFGDDLQSRKAVEAVLQSNLPINSKVLMTGLLPGRRSTFLARVQVRKSDLDTWLGPAAVGYTRGVSRPLHHYYDVDDADGFIAESDSVVDGWSLGNVGVVAVVRNKSTAESYYIVVAFTSTYERPMPTEVFDVWR